MKKFFSVISTMLVLLMAASCTASGGGTAASQPENNSEGSADKVADPSAGGEKKSLVFTHWGSPFERDCLENASRNYEQMNPGIEVKNTYIPNDEYTSKIATMLAAGQQLDCGFVSNTDLYIWGEEGRFANIYELIDADDNLSREDFIDGVFYETSDKDVCLGWFIASEPRALFYNKTIFEKAGLPYPTADRKNPMKWDEFVELCQKLTVDAKGNTALDSGFDPKAIMQYGISVGGTAYDKYVPLIFNGNGRVVDDQGKLVIDSDNTIAAIQNIQDLIFKHYVMPQPADLKNMPSGVIALSSGQVAMLADGHWNLLDLGQLDFDFDVGVLPVMNDQTEFAITNDCAPISVFKGPNEQDGYEFLKYLADPENCPQPFEEGLWFPIMKKSMTEEAMQKWAVGPAHPSGFQPTFADTLLNGKTVPPMGLVVRTKTPELETLINTKFEKIFIEGADVKQVINEEFVPEAQKILEP